jgi:ubiquinone/menaquinone biosynthesis C-methylase UbiE
MTTAPTVTSRLVNGLLAIKPLAHLAKQQARSMMIKRAAAIGVDWLQQVATLQTEDLEAERAQVENDHLHYPDYYLRPFHAYEQGNLSWEAATEVEVAAYAVHARVWPDQMDAQGDARLRQSYHAVLQDQISVQPEAILDIGCSVGMSTFALQQLYPQATTMGLDLSPYFLGIAQLRSRQNGRSTRWIHAAAEATELPDQSFGLVSACLLFHELPQSAAIQIVQEARRLLRPQGYLTIMDMNPQSEVYAKMPPYILTLLKSTEPYLDEYFSLDLKQVMIDNDFHLLTITQNSPRHRVVIAQRRA